MSPKSLEGQNLGKYRVLAALGRGGMAQVYRAYHPQLDRYVAIKVLRSDLVEDEEFLARFRREARAVAALRHTHIVQVYDFDVQDDLYYMVMELLEGDSLKAYLNSYRGRGERIPFSEIVRILSDVLNGLDYAHKEGIVHRDIKPANILLTRKGQAVITDFGVAQIVGGTKYTVSGALMGTLHYMAPEQGLQGRGDNRSDLYSLGIVFYELLTGQPPFDADTPLAILMKHVNDPLPLLHSLDPTIPESFERVILKALAKQPDDRYPDAGAMLTALLSAAQEANIEVPAVISLSAPAKGGSVQTPPVAISGPQGETPAVYSGSARQNIPNSSFAADDTDENLGKSLQVAQSNAAAGLKDEPADIPSLVKPGQVAMAAIAGGLLILFGNIGLVALSVNFKSGLIFGYGWPVELFLVSLLLSLLMSALASPYLLIPSGILVGNGILLFLSNITGRWGWWVAIWPLELIFVGGSIFSAILLARNQPAGRHTARRLGMLMAGVSAIALPVVVASAVIKFVLNH